MIGRRAPTAPGRTPTAEGRRPPAQELLFQSERPSNASVDVRAEDGVTAPDVVTMPQRRVERAALADLFRPRLRIVAAALQVGLFCHVHVLGIEAEQDVHFVARESHWDLVLE